MFLFALSVESSLWREEWMDIFNPCPLSVPYAGGSFHGHQKSTKDTGSLYLEVSKFLTCSEKVKENGKKQKQIKKQTNKNPKQINPGNCFSIGLLKLGMPLGETSSLLFSCWVCKNTFKL